MSDGARQGWRGRESERGREGEGERARAGGRARAREREREGGRVAAVGGVSVSKKRWKGGRGGGGLLAIVGDGPESDSVRV